MELICEMISRGQFIVENGVHPKDSILIVLNGEFYCSFGREEFFAKENDIVVFHRNAKFKRRIVRPINCIYMQFDSFPCELKNGIMPIVNFNRTKDSVELLKAEIENNNKHTIQHYTNDIFVCNENLYKYTEDEILKNIIEFLNNNYNKKICMSDLEEISHISRQAIHQKFKKHLGKTPIQFLQEVRMRESKTFLLNTNLLIYEIADKCGFEDAYYFSNSFKKWVGISPRSYRNKFKI